MGMIDKITIGVADLYYTAPGSETEVYLGLTQGGGEFEYEPVWHDIDDIDQFGKTVVDSILIGEKANYKSNIVDTSLPAIKRVAPTATEVLDGSDTKALTFGQRPGLRMQDHTGRLRVHPVSAGFDKSRDIIIYRAGSKSKLGLSFKLDKEWVVPCEWNAYPDEDRPIGDQLFRIGDSTAVIIAPAKRMIDFYISMSVGEMTGGSNQSITATAIYEDGTSDDVSDIVTWVTSSPTVASVTVTGTTATIAVTAVATNTPVLVTAMYGTYSCSASVLVTP